MDSCYPRRLFTWPVASKAHWGDSRAGASTIDGATNTVDAVGNRTAKTDQLAGVPSNYAYDAIYELTNVTQGTNTTESYTYDPVGNRLSSLGVSPYNYNASNELTSTPSTTYTYDSSGNTASKTDATGTANYTWDFENRLASVTLPASGGTVSFKYDPFGKRIYKSSSLGISIYSYDGDNLIEETNASGAAVARYSQGLNIDEPLAMVRSGATSYYQADGLGSVTSLTNSAGAAAQTYTYDSFGKQTGSSGSLTNPFQYTAREFDSETGLYFYRARYHDPQIGRFLLEDPVYTGDEKSLYAYVGNNPTNYVDPWGLCRILFNGSQIRIETNNGSQKLGPFPAANKTVCNCGLKEGVYQFDPVNHPPQWLVRDGQETKLGSSDFDGKRTRHQAFGPVRIPLQIPGRPGIMIHSRYPDTPELKPTEGCVRVHDAVASSMSQFIEAVCTADGPNSFHYYQRPW